MKTRALRTLMVCACLGVVGCVQTVYEKTVTVNKDASGNVQGIAVVEKVTQNRTEPPLAFTWLGE